MQNGWKAYASRASHNKVVRRDWGEVDTSYSSILLKKNRELRVGQNVGVRIPDWATESRQQGHGRGVLEFDRFWTYSELAPEIRLRIIDRVRLREALEFDLGVRLRHEAGLMETASPDRPTWKEYGIFQGRPSLGPGLFCTQKQSLYQFPRTTTGAFLHRLSQSSIDWQSSSPK